MIPVLGHGRVLHDAAVDPRRRILDGSADRLDGIAGWEPLFGRHAEGVVALRDTAHAAAAARLFHGLLERASNEGVLVVRFVLLPGQAALAAALAAGVAGAALAEQLTVRLDG